MERAIKDLCQLPDARFFEEVATGIGHVVEVVERLDPAAHKLSEVGDHHPARILGNLAEEEAAKVLILVDAVRCPRSKQAERSRTLGYFYDHLAKGIYTQVCHWRSMDLAHVTRGIEQERVEHYLDGPNGVDWIFPNRITQEREDDLYVSYVRDDSDEEGQGERYWSCPHNENLLGHFTPPVINVARALHQVGATAPAGLAVVADVWQPVEVRPEMRFHELEQLNWRTLEVLEERGLLADAPGEVRRVIRDRWPFPLWPLDLGLRKVEKERLRDVQRQWSPEDW
ncbi:MAG: AbiV family abortive infection protein [Gemmatimonadetes bacterium]|nr:AbiV family abortive infection protein [Gemmatimonadota bacterium]